MTSKAARADSAPLKVVGRAAGRVGIQPEHPEPAKATQGSLRPISRAKRQRAVRDTGACDSCGTKFASSDPAFASGSAKRGEAFGTRTFLCFPGDPPLELKPPRKGDDRPFTQSGSRPLLTASLGEYAGEGTIGAPRERPWQYAVGGYEVRQGDAGTWGIYTRKYNVRLAVFNPNSHALRGALARMFDAAHALVESEKARDARLVSNGWHTCGCGQWVHDKLAPCSVCKPRKRKHK